MTFWWPRVKSHMAIIALLLLALTLYGQRKITSSSSNDCSFPAIFNFGDSNSDTGEASATFQRVTYPNGFSFFGKPSGRFCDGRIIIDFIAEKFGIPYLSPYLDSFASNFKHGVNFAASGSTIQHADGRIFGEGLSPFSLDIQILQFEQFKDRTFELYNQGKWSWFLTNNLPKPEDFSKSLYTFDIGQNDLHDGIFSMTEKQLVETIPNLISLFSTAVEKLYDLGARTFWIHNTGPIGCLPYDIITYPQKPENRDQIGCTITHNEIAQEFNRQLKDKVYQFRKQFLDAAFTYTDVYTAKYSLISEAKKHGKLKDICGQGTMAMQGWFLDRINFNIPSFLSVVAGFGDPLSYCCGHYGDYRVECDKNIMVNRTEGSRYLCSKPENFISWDGLHYTQSANEKVADTILDGSLSDPPMPINEACSQNFPL